MEKADFRDLFKEHIESKGFNIKKLAELTGIPERYIEALATGQGQTLLPPAPYVRGYLSKLSLVLDFDKEAMWRLYQDDSRIHRSGQTDKLPSNRFAVKTLNKRWLIGGLASLFLFFYLGINVYQMFNAPTLKIIFPATETLVWSQPSIILRGVVESANTLTINGIEVYVSKDGNFEKDYSLLPGLNTIEFIAKKFLGRENKVVRQVIYKKEEINSDEPQQEQRAEE